MRSIWFKKPKDSLSYLKYYVHDEYNYLSEKLYLLQNKLIINQYESALCILVEQVLNDLAALQKTEKIFWQNKKNHFPCSYIFNKQKNIADKFILLREYFHAKPLILWHNESDENIYLLFKMIDSKINFLFLEKEAFLKNEMIQHET